MTGVGPSGTGPNLSQRDFEAIAVLVQKNFGLQLAERKKNMVHARLAKRLPALGLSDFGSYRQLLEGSDGSGEREALLSALTTNVTHFFRELHHFDLFRRDLLAGLVERAKSGGRVRIWSAGCSTGQEPYSIAMSTLQDFPEAAKTNFRILATDIDPDVVEKAKAAIYRTEEVAAVPPEMRKRFFLQNTAGAGQFCVTPELRSLVWFGTLNLIEKLPMTGPFDAIFCRNVTIYFDAATQAAVWTRLIDVLGEGGHLFAGHSEQISGPRVDEMSRAGPTTYQKTAINS